MKILSAILFMSLVVCVQAGNIYDYDDLEKLFAESNEPALIGNFDAVKEKTQRCQLFFHRGVLSHLVKVKRISCGKSKTDLIEIGTERFNFENVNMNITRTVLTETELKYKTVGYDYKDGIVEEVVLFRKFNGDIIFKMTDTYFESDRGTETYYGYCYEYYSSLK